MTPLVLIKGFFCVLPVILELLVQPADFLPENPIIVVGHFGLVNELDELFLGDHDVALCVGAKQ